MKRTLTRRDFIKLAGCGAVAASAVLARPNLAGWTSGDAGPHWLNTLCGECPGGCALRVLVAGGSVRSVEPNPAHPMGCSAACTRLEAARSALEDPQRLSGPLHRSGGSLQATSWRSAVSQLAGIFRAYRPDQIAFVLGEFPDHLNDLVQLIAGASGASVLRFSPHSLLDGRITLLDAAHRLFARPSLPHFDVDNAGLVFSFGVTGEEAWLRTPPGRAWVHFSPLPIPASGTNAEWVMIRPGSEAVLARALAGLVARTRSAGDAMPVDLQSAALTCGLPIKTLEYLARRFATEAAVAVPGTAALAQSCGPEAAQSILALNAAGGRLGVPGGVYLPLDAPIYPELRHRTSTLAEVAALLERIEAGQIKVLLVHGVDLVASLPAALVAGDALETLDYLVSFHPLANETAALADLLLPDHLPLESWGYHNAPPAADRPLVSAIQPVVLPGEDTRATADVLLAAAQQAGGNWAVPFRSETAFIAHAIRRLHWDTGAKPLARWLAQGGWWPAAPQLLPVTTTTAIADGAASARETGLRLVWSSEGWDEAMVGPAVVGVHPQTLSAHGLLPGAHAQLATQFGEMAVRLTVNPALWPETLALAAPTPSRLALFGGENASGDLAWSQIAARLLG